MARRHLEGDGRRARIGIVVPSVNTVMEPWAQKVVPEGVSVFAARMFIPPATTPEAFIEMDRSEGKAAIRQLSSVFPDGIAYGCTASSIVQGLAYDAHLRAEIERDYGTPSTTAAHAILTAARALGVATARTAHVGDSRAYLWRQGQLARLTRDHSWIEEQMAAGLLDQDEARSHPWRNLVTRALTGGGDPLVEIAPAALERGDRVLLCTDGLTAAVTEDIVADVLGRRPAGGLDAVCQMLVDAANAAGGPDNITVAVIEIDDV